MSRYHINPKTGTPGVCKAKMQYPFGGEDAHYGSSSEAQTAYEKTMEEYSTAPPLSKLQAPLVTPGRAATPSQQAIKDELASAPRATVLSQANIDKWNARVEQQDTVDNLKNLGQAYDRHLKLQRKHLDLYQRLTPEEGRTNQVEERLQLEVYSTELKRLDVAERLLKKEGFFAKLSQDHKDKLMTLQDRRGLLEAYVKTSG